MAAFIVGAAEVVGAQRIPSRQTNPDAKSFLSSNSHTNSLADYTRECWHGDLRLLVEHARLMRTAK
jgi:hypothetical protein